MKNNIKSPVALRVKELKNGNKSLYLDIYFNGKRSYEFLKLYLTKDTKKNKITLDLANTIRAKREVEIQCGEYNITTKATQSILLIDALDKYLKENTRFVLFNVKKYFSHVKIKDVDDAFLEKFADTLFAKGLKNNSIAFYINNIKGVMNRCAKDNLISKKNLKNPLKIVEVNKCYLTKDEINTTIEKYYELKLKKSVRNIVKCFIFSCLTGLRLSDIGKLTWQDVRTENGRTRLFFTQKKTKNVEYLDISATARKIMGEKTAEQKHTDFVFDFPFTLNYNDKLRWFFTKIGIDKHLTYHSSRHTFAILMLELDVDLYTVSKMLGHRDLGTTQIYARIVDEKKRKAIDKLDDALKI